MSANKRILHVLGGDSFKGGCGKVVSDICSWSCDDFEHGVMVSRNFREKAPVGCTLLKTGRAGMKTGSILYDMLWFPSECMALSKAIECFNPVLLHAHTRIGMFASVMLASYYDLSVMVHMHFLGRHKRVYSRLLSSSRVIAVANSLKTMSYYGLNDTEKVIYPSIDWPPAPAPATMPPSERRRCVTASEINEVKKVDLMMDAWCCRGGGRRPGSFVIFGGRKVGNRNCYERSLTDRALKLSGVELRGWTDRWRDEIIEGDVYVHLSTMDSFGLSLLEAFSEGLPVVVSRETFLNELPEAFPLAGVYEIADETPESVLSAIRDACECKLCRADLWKLRSDAAKLFSHQQGRYLLEKLYTWAIKDKERANG